MPGMMPVVIPGKRRRGMGPIDKLMVGLIVLVLLTCGVLGWLLAKAGNEWGTGVHEGTLRLRAGEANYDEGAGEERSPR